MSYDVLKLLFLRNNSENNNTYISSQAIQQKQNVSFRNFFTIIS